jgi:hypothetical protein
MAQILDDNTVVPSFQGLIKRGRAEPTGNLSNLALRMGEVKDIIYKDDQKSITKQFTEYTVEVQHRDGGHAGTTTKYIGCLVNNLFGGAADTFRYTLRKDDQSKKQTTDDDGIGVGSKVLLLCVNGQTTRAMIMGGLRDIKVKEKDEDKKDDGHNLFFEFNGISVAINKDGEAKIAFRGATKVDGTLDTDAGADEKKGPTTVEFLKNGNLKIYTKDDKQHVLIDHENKKADFLFDEEWKVKVNKKVTEDYGDAWECSVGSSIKITAKKDISFETSGGDWNMKASGKVTIKSSGVQTGDATDATMMGDTFRNAQKTMNNALSQGFQDLIQQLTQIGIAVNGPLKIPMVGGAAASAVAGPAVIQCVQIVGKMMAAIKTFEGQSSGYLSTKNKSD